MIKTLKHIYKITGIVILKKRSLIFYNRLKRGKKETIFKTKIFKLNNKHVFFGYYDLNPISINNDKILSLVVPEEKSTLNSASVGYFNIYDENKFYKLAETKTWCWQQGARLKWSLNKNEVIYNNLNKNKYGCVFQNIETLKISKQISFPIYDFSNDEKFGLSLNFSRLQRLRAGYGYSNLEDQTENVNAPKDDGVFLIDIEKNTSNLIISLEKLSLINPKDTMIGAEHYINHLSWNKSSKRFLFFHLWKKGNFRSSRLFTSDKEGENICLLENDETVSHYDWKNDEYICLTTHSKKNGLRYVIYKDLSTEKEILNANILNEDGHPTYHPKNKNLILSDTYPNKYGERSLFLYNVNKEKQYIKGVFKSPIKYRADYRCDLHPRWNNDGTKIAFDSTHTNKRTINIIDFENTIHS